jgi:ATP-binding cassette subfamily B protein
MPSATNFQRAPGAPQLPATPLAFVLRVIRRFRWWYTSLLVLETAHATSGIMIPYVLSEIIRGVTHAREHSLSVVASLQTPFLWFIALAVSEVIFARTAGGLQFHLLPIQRHSVMRELYAYVQQHSHRYLSNEFAGALAHRISETAQGVNHSLSALLFDFWPIAIVIGVSVALLFHAHPQLGSFVATWAVLFIGISFILATRCRPFALRSAAARSDTVGKLVDSVANLTSARLFARLGFERQLLDDCLERELKTIRVSNRYTERVRWFQFLSATALKVGVLYYSLQLWASGQIGVPEFVMATSLSLLIINESRNLSRRFMEFFEFIGNIANGVDTLVRPHELIDRNDAPTANIHAGRIEFNQVDFSYVTGQPIFRNMNIVIPAGQRVGLVGFSGSGKSTFVSLILRLHDPQQGSILIDGTDIRTVTQESLHSRLSLIPQDPSLFHRSLKENIRYGQLDATDAQIEAAARQAYADEFIADMKDGYDSMVGERGVKLSGGQRQRIAIARVILKNAPVLILDEATSSLDSITEEAIQSTLEVAMRGKTVIVVAHRLSTIAHLDRILVFNAGRIVEDGSHGELLRRGGAYFQLWSRQAGGFLPEDSPAAGGTAADSYVGTRLPQMTADDEESSSNAEAEFTLPVA